MSSAPQKLLKRDESYRKPGERIIPGLADASSISGTGTSNSATAGWAEFQDIWQIIDALSEQLGARQRHFLLLHFGGIPGTGPLSFAAIGTQYNFDKSGRPDPISKQAVQQSIHNAARQLIRTDPSRRRKHPLTGSLYDKSRLASLIKKLTSRLSQDLIPLTPQMMEQTGLGRRAKYPAGFYIRLLTHLSPELPALPEGFTPHKLDEESEKICAKRLLNILRGETETKAGTSPEKERGTVISNSSPAMPIGDAYQLVRQTYPDDKTSRKNFIEHVIRSEGFTLAGQALDLKIAPSPSRRPENPAPGHIRVIVEASDTPLTSEEIFAKLVKLPPGTKGVPTNSKQVTYYLEHGKEFFLLGPKRFGTRKHFTLEDKKREEFTEALIKILIRRRRPTSIREALHEPELAPFTRDNLYELSAVATFDARVKRVGRQLFGLAKWETARARSAEEIIVEALSEADRPLHWARLNDVVREEESIHFTSLSNALQRSPEIVSLGGGFYGLRRWNSSPAKAS